MLPLGFTLLLCLFENTGALTLSAIPSNVPVTTEMTSATINISTKLTLQLVATPDYPVAEGQTVSLHCSTDQRHEPSNWTWYRVHNKRWEEAGTGQELVLTKSDQSGTYACTLWNKFYVGLSNNLTVYIIPMPTTVAEKLGIAAFIFSLLTLVGVLAILFWMCWQKLDNNVTVSNAAIKSFPGPGNTSKAGLPEMDDNRDVYMNYTNTNQAYTDLDPASITEDNVYSSLS